MQLSNGHFFRANCFRIASEHKCSSLLSKRQDTSIAVMDGVSQSSDKFKGAIHEHQQYVWYEYKYITKSQVHEGSWFLAFEDHG